MKKESSIRYWLILIILIVGGAVLLFKMNDWRGRGYSKKQSKQKSERSSVKEEEKVKEDNSPDRKEWDHLVKGKNPGHFPDKSPTKRFVEIVFLKKKRNGKLVNHPLTSFTIIKEEGYISSGSHRIFRYRYPLSEETKERMLREDTEYDIIFYVNSEQKEIKIRTPKVSELSSGDVKYFPVIVQDETKQNKEVKKEKDKTWKDMRFSSIQVKNLPVVKSERFKKTITYFISEKVVEEQVSPEVKEIELDLTDLSLQRIKKVHGGVLTVSITEVDENKQVFHKTLAYRENVKAGKIKLTQKDKINWERSHQQKIDLTEFGISPADQIMSVSIGIKNNEVVNNSILPGAFRVCTYLNLKKQTTHRPILKAPKGDNYVIWINKDEKRKKKGADDRENRIRVKKRVQVVSENFKWPPK